MNREEARPLVEKAIADFDRLSRADLESRIGAPECSEIVGPSGTAYQLEIDVLWDRAPGGDIRVVASIDDGTFRAAFAPVTATRLVKAPGS